MAWYPAMHITEAFMLNDDERGLIQDIDKWLSSLHRSRKNTCIMRPGEDNGDSHRKRFFVHHSQSFDNNGKLLLGTWQRVFMQSSCQRAKRVVVVVMEMTTPLKICRRRLVDNHAGRGVVAAGVQQGISACPSERDIHQTEYTRSCMPVSSLAIMPFASNSAD